MADAELSLSARPTCIHIYSASFNRFMYVCESNSRHCWHGHPYRRNVRYRTPSWVYHFFLLMLLSLSRLNIPPPSTSSWCPSTLSTAYVLSHHDLSIGLLLFPFVVSLPDLPYVQFMLQVILAMGSSAPRPFSLDLLPSFAILPSKQLEFTSGTLL